MDDEDLKEIGSNPYSKRVVLKEDEIAIANLFLTIPNEVGMSGVMGKKYEAIKDYLRWNELEVKMWTPVIYQMGIIWSNEINSDG